MKRFVLVVFVCWSVLAIADAEPVIFIVRHAEKGTTGGDDPDLSGAGQKRADALARILKDAQIAAVFVTNSSAHSKQRLRQRTPPTSFRQ